MSHRIKIIAGNWKLNGTPEDAIEYFSSISKLGSTTKNTNSKKVIFPVAYCLHKEIQTAAKNAAFELGAQNVHWEDKGAYTGELSASVLKKIGINWCLIGHSERRQYFGETNESTGKRLSRAIQSGLNVIFCIGETLSERETGNMNSVLEAQLLPFSSILKANPPALNQIVCIAYEPVWAIGTGKTATPEQAEEAHQFIRNTLSLSLSNQDSKNTSILYGGSVTPENVASLLNKPNVDGALVGGASLKPEQFIQICSA